MAERPEDRRAKLGEEGMGKTTIPAFFARAHRERKRREFEFRPQVPAILAMSLPLLSKRGGKEGQKNGDLLVSVLRKAGKANYTSRLATRGCACALIPVAILPVQRHRKQTQFLVSPSLGGGAF